MQLLRSVQVYGAAATSESLCETQTRCCSLKPKMVHWDTRCLFYRTTQERKKERMFYCFIFNLCAWVIVPKIFKYFLIEYWKKLLVIIFCKTLTACHEFIFSQMCWREMIYLFLFFTFLNTVELCRKYPHMPKLLLLLLLLTFYY